MAINYTDRLGLGGRSSLDVFSQAANLGPQYRARELTNQVNQKALDALTRKDSFLDMYTDARQFLTLPEEQKQPFIQRRLQRLQSEGKDTTNTESFLKLSPEEQLKSFQNMSVIGAELGFITPSRPAPKKNLTIKKIQLEDGNYYHIGFDPTTGEPVRNLGRAEVSKGTTVNLNTQSGSSQEFAAEEFKKGMGKNLAKRYESLGTQIEGHKNQLQATNRIMNLLPNVKKFQTGLLSKYTQPLQEIAEGFGMDIEGLDEKRMIEGITNKLATTVRVAGSGSTSDLEFKAYKSTFGDVDAESPSSLLKKAYYNNVLADYNKGYKEKEQELLERAAIDPTFNLGDVRSELRVWEDQAKAQTKKRLYEDNPYLKTEEAPISRGEVNPSIPADKGGRGRSSTPSQSTRRIIESDF